MPQSKGDILLCSTADWDNPFWTNKQHMAVQFASHGYRVLYVDSLGLRRPTMRSRDLGRMAQRLCRALPVPRQVRPGFWRVSPLVVPFQASPFLRRVNDTLLVATLGWHLHLLGLRSPLIWSYNPMLGDVVRRLPHRGVVYHCVDDLRAAPGIDATAVEMAEKQFGRIADVCFVTSRELQHRMTPLFPDVRYEDNVCDVEHFRTARSSLPEPADLADIPRPRLLFIGALSQYKVDYPLMERVAGLLPQAHWVLIGAVGEGQPETAGPPTYLPNVHHLGPRPYTVLPQYMGHADIAVLPAPQNRYTASMFPMKFFEYLAAGLPLVASNLPALKEYRELFFPADGPDAFVRAVKNVLAGERRDQTRIDTACDCHSWTARFLRMETVFSPLLSDEGSASCRNPL